MKHNIETELFKNANVEGIETDFPLIAVMAQKNNYEGLTLHSLKVKGETVSMAIVNPDSNGKAKICAIETTLKHRRNGYGTALLQYLVAEYPRITALALREVVGFYVRSLFRIVADRGGQIIEVESAI